MLQTVDMSNEKINDPFLIVRKIAFTRVKVDQVAVWIEYFQIT